MIKSIWFCKHTLECSTLNGNCWFRLLLCSVFDIWSWVRFSFIIGHSQPQNLFSQCIKCIQIRNEIPQFLANQHEWRTLIFFYIQVALVDRFTRFWKKTHQIFTRDIQANAARWTEIEQIFLFFLNLISDWISEKIGVVVVLAIGHYSGYAHTHAGPYDIWCWFNCHGWLLFGTLIGWSLYSLSWETLVVLVAFVYWFQVFFCRVKRNSNFIKNSTNASGFLFH